MYVCIFFVRTKETFSYQNCLKLFDFADVFFFFFFFFCFANLPLHFHIQEKSFVKLFGDGM